MKYCVEYRKNFRYINDIDEINIKYRKEDTSLEDFFLKYQEKRINIQIEDIDDFINNNRISFFDALIKKYPNLDFSFKLDKTRVKELMRIVKATSHKFFFSTFVRDWDTLYGFINEHPSDIYIVENLAFELDKVAEVCHRSNVRVRVFPNIAQSAWNASSAIKKFFIRPEDVKEYEKYVDVMEFLGRPEKQDIYYKVYSIDKKWYGKLNEIILDFDSEIDSRFIMPQFGERRVRCGKRCLKGGTCKMCETIEEAAASLQDKGVIVSSLALEEPKLIYVDKELEDLINKE